MLWMILPPCVIGVVSLVVGVRLWFSQGFTIQRFEEGVTPSALRIFFVTYPIVTNVAFEAFSCYEFEGGSGWLVADVLIKCDTHDHHRAKNVAWLAIALYPVGLIVLNGWLLFSIRHAVGSGMPTTLSRVLAWLHGEFQPHLFWCRSIQTAK